ncbi:MAG: hypothetical protein IKE16_04120 [Solobacterium sp.]|nr:hypothetical protein [Solobacterium sp.]MBR2793813.1 hypothetical protein [Solobacterium sp.]
MNHRKNDNRLETAERQFLAFLPEKLSDLGEEAARLEEEKETASLRRREEIEEHIDEIRDEIYHIIADAGKDRTKMN